MRYQRAMWIASAGVVLLARPVWSQGGAMMGRGGMMGGDSTTSAVMRVVHELITNHEKLRRTVVNLPNGIRTVTESDDPVMAQQLKAHVASTGAFVTKGVDPNLPMSTSALHGVLQNGTRIVRDTRETTKGVAVTETSTDSATVALLQAHAAEVTDLVNRGMVAAQESMMKSRGVPPRGSAAATPNMAPTGAAMVHTPGMQHSPDVDHGAAAVQPTQGGQAAFATVQEIVKILEADPSTDWSKVDLEALRQHLIDMDAVTMRARVKQTSITGGLTMDVTGEPAVAASARRMLSAHAPMLESMGGWRASTAPIAGGIRFTVVASNPADSATIARIRGLGLIGLMVQGEHHTAHHLMIAKGAGAAAHSHGMP
jgi:hypothetical protein